MTLEEALATPGTLVATWHEVADDEELARVQVFSVGAAGATRVAEVEVKRRLRHTTFNTVYERGARLGCNQVAAPYVWVADEQGLLLWSATALIVKADRAVLEVRGKPVGVTQIAKVSSLGDARPSVRLELTSGESIALAEASDGSGGDAAWAHELGRDVANWLELPHDDHITETSNADELRVAALMHRFSDRIEDRKSVV